MVRFVLLRRLLTRRLAADNVACKQDFRFPVFGGRNIFNNNTSAASAVDADNAFRGIFNYHGYMLNTTAASEENKIAWQHLFEGNPGALTGLRGRAGGHFQVEFFENVAGKSGAIESGFWRSAGVAVTNAQEILGVTGDIAAHLHRFYIFGAVSRTAAYTLEGRASDENEQ